MFSNFIKIVILAVSINNFHIYADLHKNDSSQNQTTSRPGSLKSSKRSFQRLSLSCGGGRHFNFAGINVKYDWYRLGTDLSIGATGFPDLAMSIRSNRYLKNGLIVFSPGMTIFIRDRLFLFSGDEREMSVGLSLNFDLRTYLNESLFLINNIGAECIVIDSSIRTALPLYHSGIGLGFTFGGASLKESWIYNSQKSTRALAFCSTVINSILTASLFFPMVLIASLAHVDQ